MPRRAPKPCAKAGCGKITLSRFCEAHAREEQHRVAEVKRKADDRRPSAARRGYNVRWKKARATFLQRNPLCVECERLGMTRQATVVDHIEPHRGDTQKFWDTDNWQALCKRCHDRKTANEEGAWAKQGTSSRG
ncbi:HNH endonuclease [Algiphilus sp.]|uniref:HNH endonuclease n=1 Tax=Algiphilus sp. TaxID=1872431 RepID=UPI003CCBF45C